MNPYRHEDLSENVIQQLLNDPSVPLIDVEYSDDGTISFLSESLVIKPVSLLMDETRPTAFIGGQVEGLSPAAPEVSTSVADESADLSITRGNTRLRVNVARIVAALSAAAVSAFIAWSKR